VSLLYTFKRVEKRSELGASFYFFNCETTKPPSPYLGRVLYKIIITYLVFCLFPRGVLTASSSPVCTWTAQGWPNYGTEVFRWLFVRRNIHRNGTRNGYDIVKSSDLFMETDRRCPPMRCSENRSKTSAKNYTIDKN